MDRGIVAGGFLIAVGTIVLIGLHFAEKYLDKQIKNRGKNYEK